MTRPILFAFAVLVVGCGGTHPVDDGASGFVSTDDGHYRIAAEAALDPIRINAIHDWTVIVTERDGEPVEDARIVLEGDMPEHQHGLPTVPKMTEETAPGVYRIEGVKFSMPGHWQMTFTVWSKGVTDRVTLDLTLE